MFGAKIDLFKKEWLDVVFASKNKNYGAYELRKTNSSTTTRALIIASVAYIVFFFAPRIYALVANMAPEEQQLVATEVVVVEPPPIDEATPPPVNVEPPPPKNDQVKFPPPEVKPDNQVRDEEPPKLEELKRADPGQKTIAGDPDADIQIAAPVVGEGPKQAAVVEDNKVYDYISLEVMPEYPGGINAFRDYINKAVRYPPLAMENGTQGTVHVEFTVEKDGSITNVTVARKVGSGLDDEAIRVVRASKKWTPGVQNGKEVRVRYNVPVNFKLN